MAARAARRLRRTAAPSLLIRLRCTQLRNDPPVRPCDALRCPRRSRPPRRGAAACRHLSASAILLPDDGPCRGRKLHLRSRICVVRCRCPITAALITYTNLPYLPLSGPRAGGVRTAASSHPLWPYVMLPLPAPSSVLSTINLCSTEYLGCPFLRTRSDHTC